MSHHILPTKSLANADPFYSRLQLQIPFNMTAEQTVSLSANKYVPVDAVSILSEGDYTADDAIEAAGMGRFQYILLFITGLCWTAESMEMLLLSFIKQPLQCQWNISDVRAAAITTSVGVGMFLGSISWGVIGDRFGRRVAFIASTAFTFLLGLASAIAPNYITLVLARGAVGFGIGGIPVSFSILMEFLPSSQRGTWGMALSLFWSLGAIFEAAVAMAVLPTLGWRALVAVSSAPLGFVLLLAFFVPESPRYLAARGKLDKAQTVVTRVSELNKRQLPSGRLVATAADVHRKPSPKELLKPGARLLATKIVVMWFVAAFIYYGLVMLQPELITAEKSGRRCNYAAKSCKNANGQEACDADELCVWNAEASGNGTCNPRKSSSASRSIVSEIHTIELWTVRKNATEQDGKSNDKNATSNPACDNQLSRSDFVATLLASIGELPGTVVAFSVINYLGRRPVLGWMFGQTALVFIALLWCIGRTGETVAFFLGRGTSTAAFQAIYIFTNEIYPARIRATAMGVSSSVARLGLITTPLVAQYLTNVNIFISMSLYAGFSFLAVVAVILTPIETNGRPLLETMDQLVDELRLLKGYPVNISNDEQTQEINREVDEVFVVS